MWRAILAQRLPLVANPLVLAAEIAEHGQELLWVSVVSPRLQV